MNSPLLLAKTDYLPSELMPVAVADRAPQPSFPPHTHEFSEIVIVWRGNGLHVLNDRPWRVTCGDIFYIRDRDCHSYDSVHDLVLDNILYCPERFRLAIDWAELLPPDVRQHQSHWRLTTRGMALTRGVIQQLAQESRKTDQLSIQLTEALFLQLALILRRHRYAPEQHGQLPEGEQLDLLMAAIQGDNGGRFELGAFCLQHRLAERGLKQLFRQQTGMTIGHYQRQLQLCRAKYLLRRSDCLIGEVAARCGFDDSNYFSVVFTRETGVTPSAWRQRFERGRRPTAEVKL
ncbi:HTH-type transcriptional activator RhaR [Serratia ficaria]|uniref:HTH-type transcriptional activator RhaR n=2 Tax=Serratia ficaria TaxID=61651 RepID=A0A240C058_SERFI|nr:MULTISPECIES: HTH-type transcriptional activator RhaR [Serratia]MEE4482274.1 HTH-type transcriptional activator RhaR [Serratia ficaria]REF44757.1 AraC family L-rhamnose operon transcriptional activator RhaR [Serratia ficaria]CAI0695765.1 L-rhamnose operon transcriptional activator rhaR [Serratia ficaria]CAI0812930.1 L-rhamnose operon transcriptional activator rhaR [Serratia ficaria]CAI0819592.1 L-rhamnose operon transcriptional activator rhaR [Serratia ficaria]